mmetsp:Transcript_23067/g.68581  ORF Transcript_23067/g.68581 Transcript_23067/m.68581 type:complete len:216 (+) Transcript_23067:552-1199(+)
MERDRRDGLVSRADHDTGGGQRLDAAGHAVERVIQEIGGHLDQLVNRLVRGVDRASADADADAQHPVWPTHLHRRGGHAHGSAHHLKVGELPDGRRLVQLVAHERNHVLVGDALLLVRQRLEALEHVVQLILLQLKAKLLQARAERVAPRVLAQHDAGVLSAARQPDALGRHDLVRLPALQHAVLVDARLVRKRVGADDRLVRLHHHAAVVGNHT